MIASQAVGFPRASGRKRQGWLRAIWALALVWGAYSGQTAEAALELPNITSSPMPLTLVQGEDIVLEVVAEGSEPLSYQWFKSGFDIDGATNASLVISNAIAADSGNYRVEVSNPVGSALSSEALVTVLWLDLGDAPDPSFPTLLAQDGAAHQVQPGFHLGSAVDYDLDGLPQADAEGDDMDGGDDEDGIRVLTFLAPGLSATLEVVASGQGLLSAWVDFNANGVWEQPDEQALSDSALVAGTNLVEIAVPPDAATGQLMSRFRFSTQPSLGFTGLAQDGEVEDHALMVVPSADLAVSLGGSAAVVDLGAESVYSIVVTNQGLSTAQAVLLEDELPSGMSLIQATSSQGSCTSEGQVVRCDLGSIAPGAVATASLRVQADAVGTKVNQASVSSSEPELTPADNVAEIDTLVVFDLGILSNPQLLTLPVITEGPADIYPSTIAVGGQTASVHKVVVQVQNINHDYPDDLDLLLVAPNGDGVLLMSDVAGDLPLINTSLTFDDDATMSVPDSVDLVPVQSGTYRPSNSGFSDAFPPPAPGGYGLTLSFLEGVDPNGIWSLYVVDDSPEDGGSIGGWSLQLTLVDPLVDLGLTVAPPSPVPVGGELAFNIGVQNAGPAQATEVVVEDLIPVGTELISAVSSQGSCQADGQVVICQLGQLAAGAGATMSIVVRPLVGGPIVNQVSVQSAQADLDSSNDEVLNLIEIPESSDVAISLTSDPESVAQGELLTVAVTVTNLGPNTAGMVEVVHSLPPEVEVDGVTLSQGSCTNLGGEIRCQLGSLASQADAQILIGLRPDQLGTVTNQAAVMVGDGSDPVLGNNTAEVTSTVLPTAGLSLRATTAPSTALLNETVIYTLTLSNAGPASATGVVLSNTFSGMLELLSVSSEGTNCQQNANSLRCEWTSVSPGEEQSVIIELLATGVGLIELHGAVAGAEFDPVSIDNEVMLTTDVLPLVDLVVGLSSLVEPGQVDYSITVSNAGPSGATAVMLTNTLPTSVEVLGITSSQGNCVLEGGRIICDLGDLAVGQSGLVGVQVRPQLAGELSSQASAGAAEAEADPVNNSAVLVDAGIFELGAYSNDAPILLSEAGPGQPYPSSIEVLSSEFLVQGVEVSIYGLSHTYADDLDFLLVGPQGQSVVLLSDAGGAGAIEGLDLRFADGAEQGVPDELDLTSGTFQPTNHGLEEDLFPEPAPMGPYGATLSVFEDMDPSGTWLLYAVDDADKDVGVVAGGWSLHFFTSDPVADLAIRSESPPAVALMSNFVYTISVTNTGPAPAHGVVISNAYPAGFALSSIMIDQGGCTLGLGHVVCQVGQVPVGGEIELTLGGRITSPGSRTNFTFLSSSVLDPNVANNAVEAVTTTEQPVAITADPQGVEVAAGEPASLMVEAEGDGPLFFQWLQDGEPVAGETNTVLAIDAASILDQGSYSVIVSNRVSSAVSGTAELTVLSAPIIVQQPLGGTNLAGSTARLEVGASGSGDLFYQWFFMNSAVPGATIASLSLPGVTPAQTGEYFVTVSNSFGVVTSAMATLTIVEADFGDAPEPGYPTSLAEGGAFHPLGSGLFLGQLVDYEPDGQPDVAARGDDIVQMADEDGIRFLDPLAIGQPVRIEVVSSASGFINAWIDFDGDLSWAEPGDQIWTNLVVNPGTNVLTATVPLDPLAEITFARFRLSSMENLGFAGGALDGEVEDYEVEVVPAVDLQVIQMQERAVVQVGTEVRYTITITNSGPSKASAVILEYEMPGSLDFVSANSSQGFCEPDTIGVVCSIGAIVNGESAVVEVVVVPEQAGIFRTEARALLPELVVDPEAATAVHFMTVIEQPAIIGQPVDTSVMEGNPAEFTVVATGGDLLFQWYYEGELLTDETNDLLRLPSVSAAQQGSYNVVVSNQAGSVASDQAQLTLVLGQAPMVEALSAAEVSSTGAVLRAQVDASGLVTSAFFEWGSSTNYGQVTDIVDVGMGDGPVEVTSQVSALEAEQEYHFRVVATNSAGQVKGADTVFAWSAMPPILELQERPEGGYRVSFLGSDGQLYVIEGTTNFIDWLALAPLLSEGAGQFYLDVPEGLTNQFFRVFSP